MRKKRNKSKKVQLTLTRITIWEIEVAPFSDPSDASTNLSSPSPYPYIEMGMVMMSKKGVPGRGDIARLISQDAICCPAPPYPRG
jgi:hypothetical protein